MKTQTQKNIVGSPSLGRLIWLISADESGTGGGAYYGFGSLWMRYQRRGDFARDIRELRERHGYTSEIKWKKAHWPEYREFYRELVEYFFRRPWLVFHCLVVRKGMIDKAYHGGDYDLARRKHFTEFIANKIDASLRARPGREQSYRIWVDPIASRYKKADEAVEIIANRILRASERAAPPIEKVISRDSKDTTSIQICDFLLGAVMDAWQQKAVSKGKRAVQSDIAEHLGWQDLRADTYPTERKFNIWYLHDVRRTKREARTRLVRLKYPLPRLTKARRLGYERG